MGGFNVSGGEALGSGLGLRICYLGLGLII